MLQDFDALFAVTRDERFVTARHSLQAIWKVALAGQQHQQLVVDRLASRFRECVTEKNGTLIRYDITEDLRKIYDVVQDETIRETALTLIATEEDSKYRKRYAGVWRMTFFSPAGRRHRRKAETFSEGGLFSVSISAFSIPGNNRIEADRVAGAPSRPSLLLLQDRQVRAPRPDRIGVHRG